MMKHKFRLTSLTAPLRAIKQSIPSKSWMHYAAIRLGAFIMLYFGLISFTILMMGLFGLAVGLATVIALVPLAVFIAIRLSGMVTNKWKLPNDYS
jgi:hypothetical protein